jgi:dihydroneopterin aldolase
MPKTYIKVRIPGVKQYHALVHGMISNRNFKTATQAEEYAAILKDRYQKLKKAEVTVKKDDTKET